MSTKEVLSLTGYSSKIQKLFNGCDACMSNVFVRFDGFDEDSENLRYVMRSKRKYKNFRFLCYNSINFSKYCIEVLDLFAETMNTLEVFDMIVPETEPENLKVLLKLQNLKVSAFKGNFQHIFMFPGMRYQSLTFENLVEPVDLKGLGEYRTGAKILTLKNCKIINLDSFTFFDGFCKEFIYESNIRNDWTEICVILKKYAYIKELLVIKKNSAGVRLVLSQHGVYSRSPDDDVHSRSKKSDEQRLSEDAEMELEKPGDDQVILFTRRTPVTKTPSKKPEIGSDEDASSSKPIIDANSYLRATLEVDELSLPLIKDVSQALPMVTSMQTYEICSSLVCEMFRHFHCLDKVVATKNNLKNEFTSNMFDLESTIDPVARLSEDNLHLVFQHFSLQEIFGGTKVAKMWNQVLGRWEVFMDSVVLKIEPSGFKSKDDKICLNGQRTYKSVELTCKKSKQFSLSALELTHAFSNSIVDLTLTDIQLERVSALKDRFIFKQLKNLTLRRVDDHTWRMLLQSCVILKSISITAMPFSEMFITLLKCNKKLEALTLTDCTFDYFRRMNVDEIRRGEKRDKVEIRTLKHFGLMFDRVNAWKIQKTDNFRKFMKTFQFTAIETVLFSGVRMECMTDILRAQKTIKKVTIKHFWENELNGSNMYRIHDSFVFESLTFSMGQNYKWKEIFPNANQIVIKRQNVLDTVGDDVIQKAMSLPVPSVASMRKFTAKGTPITFYQIDPILRIPEKVHELMIQHLSGHDIMNAFEVSQTWNNFYKSSEFCAKRTILFPKHSATPEDLALLAKSTRIFVNVVSDFYQPKMIRCFSNLRKLAIAFNVVGEFEIADAFPQLESLIIQKCPAKLYKHENILSCFEVFSKVNTLTFLEIYEAVTSENCRLIQDLLENNKKLKILKIHQCSDFHYLFSEDFSHRIHFQLDHLDYRVPQKFSLDGSIFEQNCAKFISTQKSVKIVDFNLCSAVMLNEVFKLPNVEVVRMLRITGYDHVMLQKNFTIKEFLFPDTPQMYIMNAKQYFEFRPFFDAVPNVERFYVYSLTEEMLEYATKNLKKVKFLACDRFSGNEIGRAYKKIMSSLENADINRTMKVMNNRFNLLDTEERTFDNIFRVVEKRR